MLELTLDIRWQYSVVDFPPPESWKSRGSGRVLRLRRDAGMLVFFVSPPQNAGGMPEGCCPAC